MGKITAPLPQPRLRLNHYLFRLPIAEVFMPSATLERDVSSVNNFALADK